MIFNVLLTVELVHQHPLFVRNTLCKEIVKDENVQYKIDVGIQQQLGPYCIQPESKIARVSQDGVDTRSDQFVMWLPYSCNVVVKGITALFHCQMTHIQPTNDNDTTNCCNKFVFTPWFEQHLHNGQYSHPPELLITPATVY